ncbi:MAG: hypothetical protein MdMp014T_0750 [Treponematales bacterium]
MPSSASGERGFALLRIWREYRKWRKNWDGLCRRCGLCCYSRSLLPGGEVKVDFNSPCGFFDKTTRLCRVFERRFRECRACKRVNLFRALFHPTLPPECAYARTFRVWKG